MPVKKSRLTYLVWSDAFLGDYTKKATAIDSTALFSDSLARSAPEVRPVIVTARRLEIARTGGALLWAHRLPIVSHMGEPLHPKNEIIHGIAAGGTQVLLARSEGRALNGIEINDTAIESFWRIIFQ